MATTYDGRYDEFVGPTIEDWWTLTNQEAFLTIDNGLNYAPVGQTIVSYMEMSHDDPIRFDVYIKVTIANPSLNDVWSFFDISNSNWQTGDGYMDLTWNKGQNKFIITAWAQEAPGVTTTQYIDSPGNSNVVFLRMAQLDGKVRFYYAVPGDMEWTEVEFDENVVLSGPGGLLLFMTSNNPVTCNATIHYFRDNIANPLFPGNPNKVYYWNTDDIQFYLGDVGWAQASTTTTTSSSTTTTTTIPYDPDQSKKAALIQWVKFMRIRFKILWEEIEEELKWPEGAIDGRNLVLFSYSQLTSIKYALINLIESKRGISIGKVDL